MNEGYVYVLSNPAMPGLIKVGMTTGLPETRAAQLNTTGVPEPFVLEAKFFCPDCVEFEQVAHEDLREFRVSSGKEFFRIDISFAIQRLTGMHASIISDWLDRFAPEYTIVESEAFVDPSQVYLISDELGEDVDLVALAMSNIRADEVAPSVYRMKKKLIVVAS